MLYGAKLDDPASGYEEWDAVYVEYIAGEGQVFVAVVDGAGKVVDATRYVVRFSPCCFAFYST